MHSFIYSSLSLSITQIAIIVSDHISTALRVEDDTGKNSIQLKLPRDLVPSTEDYKKDRENESKKDQGKRKKETK